MENDTKRKRETERDMQYIYRERNGKWDLSLPHLYFPLGLV